MPDGIRWVGLDVHAREWPRWNTSLPGSGYDITTVLPLSGRVFAASTSHVYELDAVSGNVLRSLAVGGSGDTRLALASEPHTAERLCERRGDLGGGRGSV
jgi:hypothetical protein